MEFTFLQEALKAMRAAGKTNQEIADLAGVSQQHINRLLNGSADALGKVKLETLVRLFPRIFENIDQSSANIHGIGVNSGNHATVNIHNGASNEVLGDIEQDILEDSKMCDACKVAALGIIKRHRKK